MLKIGVIGYGIRINSIVKKLVATGEVELVAIMDVDFETVKEKYLDKKCITFDAVYENLPVVDTLFSSKNERKDCGLQISTDIKEFNVKKLDEGVLRVHWDNGEVTFFESYIRIKSKEIKFYLSSEIYKLSLNGHTMHFEYNGFKYSVEVLGAVLTLDNNLIIIRPILDDCIIGFVK